MRASTSAAFSRRNSTTTRVVLAGAPTWIPKVLINLEVSWYIERAISKVISGGESLWSSEREIRHQD
jgi:hypothetical protein